MPNTKIVATLGPATDTPEAIRALMDAGVNIFRLNASHGTQDEHARRIQMIRAESATLNQHNAILLDLQGPKIRLGKFEGGGCTLKKGDRFTITTEPILGDCRRASTGYANFARDVQPGNRVLVNDGAVELRAVEIRDNEVEFDVVSGGPIGDHKGINLPGVKVSAPSMTLKDYADLEFGLREGVDMIALSFVRSPEDVEQLREHVRQRAPQLPIIAKIEKPEAIEHIAGIIDASDGLMVARGDLGVEIDLERVPPIQKSLIRKARQEGKFTITATQMLESMTASPVPTRAEVSDVANAVYDGTDAVMLSAETSAGRYPIEAANYMRKIAQETERSMRANAWTDDTQTGPITSVDRVIADAAFRAARLSNAAALVVVTTTGSSAKLISRCRPGVPIFAITPDSAVARRLAVIYGVRPIVAPPRASIDEMLEQTDRLLLADGYLRANDLIVFTAGQPIATAGTTNLMKIHRLGESARE